MLFPAGTIACGQNPVNLAGPFSFALLDSFVKNRAGKRFRFSGCWRSRSKICGRVHRASRRPARTQPSQKRRAASAEARCHTHVFRLSPSRSQVRSPTNSPLVCAERRRQSLRVSGKDVCSSTCVRSRLNMMVRLQRRLRASERTPRHRDGAARCHALKEERHHSFGRDLVGQVWDLEIRTP